MKPNRIAGACLLAGMAISVAACGSDDTDSVTGTNNNNRATVRVVNATGSALDVGTNGTFGSTNSNLAFGTGSSCVTVNAGAASNAGLSFRSGGTTFTPTGYASSNFTQGGNYTVVVTGTPGNYMSTTYTDTYAGASATNGGVRVINATTGADAYNLYVGASGTRPTVASQQNFGAGMMSSAFFGVPTGQGQVWLTTGSGASETQAYSTDPFNVAANGYQTIVITDPASGSSGLRAFSVAGCNP